jgi:RNA polymerase subunit RPABC4/transcription elongation factor Spt4
MSDANEEVYCSNCRAIISADISYCTECGAKQPESTGADGERNPEFLPADKKYCGSCGNTIDIAARYCGSCGAEQESSKNLDTNKGTSEWIIGFSEGNSVQNVIAGVFFYVVLYPIGIPTLIYSYLHYKKGWSRNYVIMLSVVCAFILFVTIALL